MMDDLKPYKLLEWIVSNEYDGPRMENELAELYYDGYKVISHKLSGARHTFILERVATVDPDGGQQPVAQ